MPRVGLTHDRVVAEAAALADEVGLARLTLAEIAARVGVAQPSLYKHIGGVESLRRDLAVLGLRELANELRRATAGRARADALHAAAEAYRGYALRRPGPYQASLKAPEADDDEHQEAASQVLEVAAAILGGYDIDGEDLVDAIRFLRAALHGYVDLEAIGGTELPRDRTVSFTRMIVGLDMVFAAWASTSTRPDRTGPGRGRRRS